MDLVDWYKLRNIVCEADSFVAAGLPSNAPSHPAIDLVRQYLVTGDKIVLDRAALMVAMQKPGVDATVAREQYWLVIDKS